MKNDTMSFKAKINNFAKACGIRPQAVLQTLMFARFLERLSRSRFRQHFVLKGGALISSILGAALRTTMDIDATLTAFPVNEARVLHALQEICAIPLDDDVTFSGFSAVPIRRDDPYGGLRIRFDAHYKSIVTSLSLDVSAGDAITPEPILYEWRGVLDESVCFPLLCYRIETILAEKVETILRRGETSTRPRDFYDVFALVKNAGYRRDVFNDAFSSTVLHRNPSERIKAYKETLAKIEMNPDIRARWDSYAKEYPYAGNIPLKETLEIVAELMDSWK